MKKNPKVFNVYKPTDLTSFDLVRTIKKKSFSDLDIGKIGHYIDPENQNIKIPYYKKSDVATGIFLLVKKEDESK